MSFVGLWPQDGEPLDGRYRIQGDIRLDARAELIAELAPFAPSSAQRVSRGDSDALLVLHAYRAWGPACVTRIHGDFSFAIRDEFARRVFCARDRFGVRPFFYASFPDQLLAGSTLEALRRHPPAAGRPRAGVHRPGGDHPTLLVAAGGARAAPSRLARGRGRVRRAARSRCCRSRAARAGCLAPFRRT